MTCHQLAHRIETLQPELSAIDVARLSLMILTSISDPSDIEDDADLINLWKITSFRLQAASDQHAAVAEELAGVCSDGPVQFNPDQLWVLLRAVKVQSEILDFYIEQPSLA